MTLNRSGAMYGMNGTLARRSRDSWLLYLRKREYLCTHAEDESDDKNPFACLEETVNLTTFSASKCVDGSKKKEKVSSVRAWLTYFEIFWRHGIQIVLSPLLPTYNVFGIIAYT